MLLCDMGVAGGLYCRPLFSPTEGAVLYGGLYYRPLFSPTEGAVLLFDMGVVVFTTGIVLPTEGAVLFVRHGCGGLYNRPCFHLPRTCLGSQD